MLVVWSAAILMKIIVDVLAGVFIMRISFGGNETAKPKRRKRVGRFKAFSAAANAAVL
jgi:hypothetical protein